MTRRVPSLPALIVWALSGCGAKVTDEARTSRVTPAEGESKAEFIAKYVEASCRTLPDCPDPMDRYGSVPECLEQLNALLEVQMLLDLPTIRYDEHEGARCLRALGESTCALQTLGARGLVNECSGVFHGEGTLGQPCHIDTECTRGLVCDRTKTCPGQCVNARQPGEVCNPTCAEGLVCVLDGIHHATMATCRVRNAEGEPCGSSTEYCEPGLGCDSSLELPVCRSTREMYPPVQLGETCSSITQCGEGAFCSSLRGEESICKLQSLAGENCSASEIGQCAPELYCSIASGVESGTCEPRRERGEACELTNACRLRPCISGICQFWRGTGRNCSVDDECYGGECDNGVCVRGPLCR